MVKNNYIMLGGNVDDVALMYSGLNNASYSQLILLDYLPYKSCFLNLIRAFLCRTNKVLSKNMQTKIEYFFLKSFQKKYYKYFEEVIKIRIKNFCNNKPLCFIVMARVFESYGKIITKYLKAQFPEAKQVTFFLDVLNSFRLPISSYKKTFQFCFSFDKTECEKFDLNYCLEPFSYSNNFQIKDITPKYDVIFIGAAKDRYDDIISVYEKLRQKNLKLDFYIFGVKEDRQKYKDEIHYNKYLSFENFIKHTLNARCTFEALQKNGSSPTTRFSMCMLYKRKLLTNCTELLEDEWEETIKTGNVQVYSDIDSIDFDWIKQPCEYDNQKYIDLFSTDKMLETMESYFYVT